MKIVFCKDGILRSFDYNNDKLLPLTFIQNLLQMENDDFLFLSRFLNQEVSFEKGLTFFNFLQCLSPWTNFWTIYSQVNLKDYLDAGKKPRLIQHDSYINEIEFSHYVNAQQTVQPKFRDKNVYIEDVQTILNSKFKDELQFCINEKFSITNQYGFFGYTNLSNALTIDIVDIPFHEWCHAQFTLQRRNHIIFEEDGLKDVMDMTSQKITKRNVHNLVFSKDMLNLGGHHFSFNDGIVDSSFSFVEGETIFTLEEIMRHIFQYLPPDVNNEESHYSKIILSSIQHTLSLGFQNDIAREHFLYNLVQKQIVNFNDNNIQTFGKLVDESLESDESLENNGANSIMAEVLPFKANNQTVESIETSHNNIIDFLAFKENKNAEPNKNILPLLDENSQIFAQMIEFAKEDKELLIDNSSILQNEPSHQRIMGLLINDSKPYFNPNELK